MENQTVKSEIQFPDPTSINETIPAYIMMSPDDVAKYYEKGKFTMEDFNVVFTADETENKNLKPVTTWAKTRTAGNSDPNMRKLTRIILDVINAYGFLPQSYISLEYKTKWYAGNGNRERVEQDPVTERAYKMFRTIRGITDFTPYRIRGRLAVKDKETGRVFK